MVLVSSNRNSINVTIKNNFAWRSEVNYIYSFPESTIAKELKEILSDAED
jgi:hypothetical protein